jgi:hypothetical protein
MVRGIGTDMPKLTTRGDVVLAPESLGAVGPGIARLHLLGSPEPLFPPVNRG